MVLKFSLSLLSEVSSAHIHQQLHMFSFVSFLFLPLFLCYLLLWCFAIVQDHQCRKSPLFTDLGIMVGFGCGFAITGERVFF